MYFTDQPEQRIWHQFVQKYNLSSLQQQQFYKYLQLLMQENQKYNLTAITSPADIILDHFYDSLSILLHFDMKPVRALADVGAGAGFPGIPLAIMCPDMKVYAIEVNQKKVHFLQMVARELALENIETCAQDWRTFLRSFQVPIDLFVARASLSMEELLRIFKPSSKFQNSSLVYWASKKWIPTQVEKEYLDSCADYLVGSKQRQLCFFKYKT